MARTPKRKKLTILVSSTVYGVEDLLNLIYASLTKFGYEVWMSHRGTVQTFSNRHAFEDCLQAVRDCDIFLSFITKQYGTGTLPGELSITHQELLLAIELNKPRWVLAHHDVVFARQFLRGLELELDDEPAKEGGEREVKAKDKPKPKQTFETRAKRARLKLKKGAVIDDLRVIDMYEDATRDEVKLGKPAGNWAQKFVSTEDGLLFANAQFHRYQEVESFLEENFKDVAAVKNKAIKGAADDQ